MIKKILVYLGGISLLIITVVYSVILMYWFTLVATNFPTGQIPEGSAPLGFLLALLGFLLLGIVNKRYLTFMDGVSE
jgi:hypothetical protein